jgi:hypothetical protein
MLNPKPKALLIPSLDANAGDSCKLGALTTAEPEAEA